MRELKFRAYSKSYDTMFTNDMLEKATTSMVNICNKKLKKVQANSTEIEKGIFLPTYDKDLEIMQYAGLNDKNGKEIYEGDIYECCEKRIKEVVWKDNGFKMKYTYERTYCGEKYTETNYLEMGPTSDERWGGKVIGNIFEKPELLKGDSNG